MKIILSHPTGNRNVHAVASALFAAGALERLYTTIAVDPESMILRLVPKEVREELLRRSFPVPYKRINQHASREAVRMLLTKLGVKNLVRHAEGWASVDAVYQTLDRKLAFQLNRKANLANIDAVYAYEDGALATFKQAKKQGIKCVYDLPIAFWETGRRLMQEEAWRLPDWASTLGGGITDSPAKLERKSQELELADVVVGPSDFVLNSLPDWTRQKHIIRAPFGSPRNAINDFNKDRDNNSSKKPLRVLFAGSMTQRKGLGDLFQAMKILRRSDIELVVMGSPVSPLEFYRKQYSLFHYEPGRPNHQVLALMHSCDVFCLPSIVEGRALVMQEAMSQGLPLVITPNTGGEDLIREGETGFLVHIRSPWQIAEKLNWYADNREETAAMGEKARAHAARYTWENYGDIIVHSLQRILK